MNQVWADANAGVGNYVRGKFMEIIIVWVVSYITFTWLGLPYTMLLSLTVGLSVVVPYIGAAVVTIPVAAVAYFHLGLQPDSWYALAECGILLPLNGYHLAPDRRQGRQPAPHRHHHGGDSVRLGERFLGGALLESAGDVDCGELGGMAERTTSSDVRITKP